MSATIMILKEHYEPVLEDIQLANSVLPPEIVYRVTEEVKTFFGNDLADVIYMQTGFENPYVFMSDELEELIQALRDKEDEYFADMADVLQYELDEDKEVELTIEIF